MISDLTVQDAGFQFRILVISQFRRNVQAVKNESPANAANRAFDLEAV
jgi:hypothetical protein